MKPIQHTEILAPAGSYESMTAAIEAGADAIYIGGSRFGARAFANNLDGDRMLEAIDYAHLHKTKLYMTVNTLMKERELGELYEYLLAFYQRGLDAVIVQDAGAFLKIREWFPDLPIHASTQMTVTGVRGARMLAQMGAERIVTARELSLQEIEKIHRELPDLEIESFVHGALCYCYSGQCLLSSLIGGRSGNRGRCAQPCRLPYEVKENGKILNKKNEKYVLSPKDLCTLDLLPQLIQAGIFSLKIEGRMKSPRYTAGVTRIYRKYVDKYWRDGQEGYFVEETDRRELLDLFDRGGQTDGYYLKHNGRDMITLKEKPTFRETNQELFDFLDKTYVETQSQIGIEGKAYFETGNAAVLTLSYDGVEVTVSGEVVQQAKNQPLTQERVEAQLKKSGNSSFYWKILEVKIKGDIFLPMQAINQLRRNGMECLKEALLKRDQRQIPDTFHTERKVAENTIDFEDKKGKTCSLYVLLEEKTGLFSVLQEEAVERVYLAADSMDPLEFENAVKQCHQYKKTCYLSLPQVFRDTTERFLLQNWDIIESAGFDGILAGSLEEIVFVQEKGWKKPIIADHNLYTWNKASRIMYQKMGCVADTLPVELNEKELLARGGCGSEWIVYGHLPVMVSAQCIVNTEKGCTHKKEVLYLKDRIGKEFPVKNHCTFCCNTIYNTSPLSLWNMRDIAEKLDVDAVRLQFTVEKEDEIRQITKAFADSYIRGISVEEPTADYTRGHIRRGVE